MGRPRKQDPEILQAALIGLQQMLGEVKQKIADLRQRLGTSSSQLAPAKRGMRSAGRKNAKNEEAAAPKAKRKLSSAGRARIIAATKKRWAAFRKEQKATASQPVRKAAPRKKAATAKALAPAPPPEVAAPAAISE